MRRFDALLLSDIPQARQVLRKIVVGRIGFRPMAQAGARGYHLRWSMKPAAAASSGHIGLASPRGSSGFITTLRRPISGVARGA